MNCLNKIRFYVCTDMRVSLQENVENITAVEKKSLKHEQNMEPNNLE